MSHFRKRTRYGGPGRPQEVYFIQAETLRLIKIGVSDCAAERLSKIQCTSPDRLHLLGVMVCQNKGRLEGELHARFSSLREHGEWYRPAPDLLAFIEANATPAGRAHEDELRAALERSPLPRVG